MEGESLEREDDLERTKGSCFVPTTAIPSSFCVSHRNGENFNKKLKIHMQLADLN